MGSDRATGAAILFGVSFNSRSRVGSDRRRRRPSGQSAGFNSRSRVGSDLPSAGLRAWHGNVSIHAPAWGATRGAPCLYEVLRFNSRSRVGSDQRHLQTLPQRREFQFTLPRGERPPSPTTPAPGLTVSIHAPAWGATETDKYPEAFTRVSIHAPAWGATSLAAAISTPSKFQFTLPRGERLRRRGGQVGGEGVSIHAPAWGATGRVTVFANFGEVSIHAPAWGATPLR